MEAFVSGVAKELGWKPLDVKRHPYLDEWRVSFYSNNEAWSGVQRSGVLRFSQRAVAMQDTQELRHIETQVRRIIRPEGQGATSFFPRFPI